MFSMIRKNDNSKILAIILIYFIFISGVALLKHYTFHSNAWDLSIFDEVIWNTSQGRFMYTGVKDINYFGDHFEAILLFFVPFYWMGLGAKFLILTQAAIISLGALPIYWLARENIDDRKFHFLFPFAYLLLLPLWHIILFDFHAEAMAITPILFAFYYLNKEKYGLFLLFLALVMLCKENMPLVGAFFGLYILLFKKRKLLGGFLLLLGCSLFAFEMQYLIPTIRGAGGYGYFDRYAYLGSNLGEFIKTIVFRPFFVLQHILIPDKIIYASLLLGAVAFLPFFSPSTFILSVPVFAQNLLCTYSGQYGFHSHYNAGIIPFLFISAVFGLKNILKDKTDQQKNKIKKRVSGIIIFFMVVSMLEFSLGFFLRYTAITKHTLYGHALIKQIPKAASVSASSNVHPHLTHRKNLWEFPAGINKAEYVIIETFDPTWPMEDKDYPAVLDKLWKNKEYKKIFGFIFLGEIRTPVKSKQEYQDEVDKLSKNKNYQIIANEKQLLLAKKRQ